MNELIKTLQVWSENPTRNAECNTSDDVEMCRGITCTMCPMNLDGNNVEHVVVKLGEFNERTNKNIKPNHS